MTGSWYWKNQLFSKYLCSRLLFAALGLGSSSQWCSIVGIAFSGSFCAAFSARWVLVCVGRVCEYGFSSSGHAKFGRAKVTRHLSHFSLLFCHLLAHHFGHALAFYLNSCTIKHFYHSTTWTILIAQVIYLSLV